MRPRLSLDIGWGDLLAGTGACLVARDRERLSASVEACFGDEALVALSARSALDLYLAARAFPPGSEVLVSALTIPDMPRVLREHGLVPVPVDLDPATLAPRVEPLARATTSRTRALLVAHLFGSLVDADPLAAFARARGIELWEDGAQAYAGDAWRGHADSALVLWSFGTIKTATALGGGVARVRDARTRERMRELAAAWPVQGRGHAAQKVLKASLLRTLGARAFFTPFAHALAVLGRDRDEFFHGLVRGFPGPRFFPSIRRQPSAALLALFARRLTADSRGRVGMRAAAGEELARRLPGSLVLAGARALRRTHWVFPLRSRAPEALVTVLRRAGFDATRRSSLRVVEPPPGRAAAVEASALLDELVFVPLVPARARDFERLVRALALAAPALAEVELRPARRRDEPGRLRRSPAANRTR
jgi:dTDP-4-amino-4,6-dideoxygalactose transaminase